MDTKNPGLLEFLRVYQEKTGYAAEEREEGVYVFDRQLVFDFDPETQKFHLRATNRYVFSAGCVGVFDLQMMLAILNGHLAAAEIDFKKNYEKCD